MRSLNASNWLDAWLALTTFVFYLFLHTFSLSFYPTSLPFAPFVRNELWRLQRRPQTKQQTLKCCATLSSICFVLFSHLSTVSLSLSFFLCSAILRVTSQCNRLHMLGKFTSNHVQVYHQYSRNTISVKKPVKVSSFLPLSLSFALALHAYLMWRFVYSVA